MELRQLYAMAKDGAFQERVQLLMVKAAIANLNSEAPTQAAVLLGQRILQGSEPVQQWAFACVTHPTIAGGAHAVDGSTLLDDQLEGIVNSMWSAFAV